MHSAVVVVDSREAAGKESGDIILSGVCTNVCVWGGGRGGGMCVWEGGVEGGERVEQRWVWWSPAIGRLCCDMVYFICDLKLFAPCVCVL